MAGTGPFILLGAIAGAHGVRGLVKIKSFTQMPEAIASYGPLFDKKGQHQFHLSLKGKAGGLLLASIEGVGDRTTAERLTGTELYVPRDRLPPAEAGSFYEADLIGLAVIDESGALLGELAAFADYGAGPVMTVKQKGGEEFILPFAPPIVRAVDLAAGEVRIARPSEVEAKEP